MDRCQLLNTFSVGLSFAARVMRWSRDSDDALPHSCQHGRVPTIESYNTFIRTCVAEWRLAFVVALLCPWGYVFADDFLETWETSPLGIVMPVGAGLLTGDEGTWFIGDTVSEFPECGATPHVPEIIAASDGRALRLTSNDSGSSCADNLFADLSAFPPLNLNPGFSVPISRDSFLSFDEVGFLIDPGPIRRPTCVVPPCGDNISLLVQDNRGYLLAYVLQRAPNQMPQPVPAPRSSAYLEIFLDPDAGTYVRNLVDDFSGIPGYNPNGAKVDVIEFRVDQHGSGTIDNIRIGASPPPELPAVRLVSSILPTSRSVEVGNTATAFATIINAGTEEATDCTIAPNVSLPAEFFFQATDPATNALLGERDEPVTIEASGVQTFLFAFTPTAPFDAMNVEFVFDCANTEPAPTSTGINTLLLSASSTPVPDILALAATPVDPGIANIPGATGTGFFTVASVNVGEEGTLSVLAGTGDTSLPVTILMCETDPETSVCINPSTLTDQPVVTTIGENETPTFAVFISGNDTVAFDPSANRVLVSFQDDGGIVRGSTSVAVRTR